MLLGLEVTGLSKPFHKALCLQLQRWRGKFLGIYFVLEHLNTRPEQKLNDVESLSLSSELSEANCLVDLGLSGSSQPVNNQTRLAIR